jgi:rhodanese-related sulfurtransferase|tara:strand:- start:1091 stop:1294 length:204 start_codon:yes stop_codon:yes gene_type:complete
MAILGTQVTSTLGTKGETQNNLDKLIDSKLHDEYSINGIPNIDNKPAPSLLDLNGKTPEKYLDNKPR